MLTPDQPWVRTDESQHQADLLAADNEAGTTVAFTPKGLELTNDEPGPLDDSERERVRDVLFSTKPKKRR